MPADDGRAANTEARGRRAKASKERNRGKWHAVVPRGRYGDLSAAEEARQDKALLYHQRRDQRVGELENWARELDELRLKLLNPLQAF